MVLLKLNSRGQASFEMLLIVIIVILLAANVLIIGIQNFSEVGALAFVHNSFDYYKVRENYTGNIKDINVTSSGTDVTLDTTLTEPLTDEIKTEISEKIESNIKDNTRYNSVDIVFNAQ